MEAIETYWMGNPDLRLSQLTFHLGLYNPFIEDDGIIDCLNELTEKRNNVGSVQDSEDVLQTP